MHRSGLSRVVFLLLVVVALSSSGAASDEAEVRLDALVSHRAGLFDVDPETLRLRVLEELRRCDEPADPHAEATCLLLRGVQAMSASAYDEGIANFEDCATALEELGDRFGAILAYTAVAEAQRLLSRHDEAAASYLRSLKALEELAQSSEPMRVESFMFYGRLKGMPEDFLRQFGPMANLMKPMVLGLIEIMVRDSFAANLMSQKKLVEAEDQLERALERSHSLFGLMDLPLLDSLAQLRQREGKLDEARTTYRQALAASDTLGDVSKRFGLLGRLADLEATTGFFQEALKTYAQALRLAREVGDRGKEASFLSDEAKLYLSLGRIVEARSSMDAALAAAPDADDGWVEASVLVDAGWLHFITADYEKAAKTYELALVRLRDLEPRRLEVQIMTANALILLGEVYGILGAPERMAEKFKTARSFAEESGYAEALTLIDLVAQWPQLGKGQVVDLDHVGSVAKIVQEMMSTSDVLSLQTQARKLEPLFARFLAARQSGQAVALPQLTEPESAETPWLQVMARLFQTLETLEHGRYDDALRGLQTLRKELRELGQSDLEGLTMAASAVAHWRAGRTEEAARSVQEAIDYFEAATLSGFHVDELLTALLDSDRSWLYQSAIEILARTGKPEEAFDMAERTRARSLLHLLGNQRLGAGHAADSELLRKADQVRAKIRGLEGHLDTFNPPEQRKQVLKTLQSLNREHDDLILRIKLSQPEYASLTSIESLSLEELRQDVPPPETTLVAYYMTIERALAWVVGRHDVTMVSLPMSEEEIRDIVCLAEQLGHGRARGFRSLASRCTGKGDLNGLYYEKLIKPLLPHISHRNLIVVPHGVLHYVPFAALRDPQSGDDLLKTYTISYAPSASVLRFLSEKSSPIDGGVLVLGDPETDLDALPAARAEAQMVAKLFGTEPLIGDAASESRIHEAAGRIDLLHVAAHGIYRPQAPRFSRIVLASGGGHDGRLEVHELFGDLDLSGVNLVVLSACQTALGEQTRGDEIIGLTRAFLYAGSPAVVSTLWKVDDDATAFLMKKFYKRLLGGATYAEALKEAQLATRRRSSYADPYFWAAFTLTGDPRGRWRSPAGR